MISEGGLLSREIPHFEHRPQQVSMMRAVVKAFNDGGRVIVEGGTGVGKSVAYLLPAMLFAAKNGVRVVVSTNTINLQEQLLSKDIPALAQALEKGGVLPSGEFKGTSLKGRANYLCMRRWAALCRSDNLSTDEARLLSKCLVWLQTTATGDKAEMNLSGKDAGMWARVSAGEKGKCLGLREGACFLRSARERAEGAHVVVVNHALLLSDMARGGSLIPHYEHLIVDEAHNLEEEATDQLGFSVSQGWLTEQTENLTRWMSDLNLMLRRPSLTDVQKADLRSLMSDAEGFVPRLRDAWARFWGANEEFMQTHRSELNDRLQVRVTRSARAQGAWSRVEEAWDNASVALGDIQTRVEKLHRYLSNLTLTDAPEANTLLSNLEAWLEESAEVRGQIEAVLNVEGQEERVDWLSQDNEGALSLRSAPLDVGARLKEELFDEKKTVILTSATLSTQGSFEFIRHRLGLDECDELTVGSPFNYKKAALVALPIDLPEPGDRSYKEALERGLASIVRAAKGHTLALFTSHSSLRMARKALIDAVEPEGHPIFAQGVDGSPHRVMQQFIDNPQGVLLGASSFWEGVDMPSGVVKVLVLVRLPFNVPTDPIFAARSEQYDDSFSQYAVPQAVLRFRQGFGRLIRNSRDRGVVVIMDRRLISKGYGRTFLDSIPDCSVRTAPMVSIGDYISQWLGK
jgi:DNA polymerase-3 subunit epsilon/ATP-dependent DNA helicase DinG